MIKGRYIFALPTAVVLAAVTQSAAVGLPIMPGPVVNVGSGATPAAVASGDGGEFFSIDGHTGVLSSFAADGSPGRFSPVSIGADAGALAMTYTSQGVIFTANFGNHSISHYKPGVDTSPTSIPLGSDTSPYSITADAAGDIFTANSIGDSVTKVAADGTVTPQFAALLPGASPRGIVADAHGNLFTANSGDDTVTMISPSGTPLLIAQLPKFASASAIAIDQSGLLYVASRGHNTVTKIDPSAASIDKVVASIDLPAGSEPCSLAVDAAGDVFTANADSDSVSVIVAGLTTATTLQQFSTHLGISGLAVTPDARLLVSAATDSSIHVLTLAAALAPKSLPQATVALPYHATLSPTGVGTVTVTGRASWPAWLTLDPSTGELGGTPPVGTPASLTISAVASSALGVSAVQQFTIAVQGGVVSTATPTPSVTPDPSGTPAPSVTADPRPTVVGSPAPTAAAHPGAGSSGGPAGSASSSGSGAHALASTGWSLTPMVGVLVAADLLIALGLAIRVLRRRTR